MTNNQEYKGNLVLVIMFFAIYIYIFLCYISLLEQEYVKLTFYFPQCALIKQLSDLPLYCSTVTYNYIITLDKLLIRSNSTN